VSQVRRFRPAIWAVAVAVQITAAFQTVSPLREPSAFFLVTTGPRIILSAGIIIEADRVVAVRDQARPFPAAFGGPGAVTVAGTRQSQARLYRRRRCAATRTITCQSSCSQDQ
jgi:hypothetical protein